MDCSCSTRHAVTAQCYFKPSYILPIQSRLRIVEFIFRSTNDEFDRIGYNQELLARTTYHPMVKNSVLIDISAFNTPFSTLTTLSGLLSDMRVCQCCIPYIAEVVHQQCRFTWMPLLVNIHIRNEFVTCEECQSERELLEVSDDDDFPITPRSRLSIKMPLKIVEGRIDGIENCSICLERLNARGYAVETPCSHVFHGDCIEKWLEQRNSCPLCRYMMPTTTGQVI